MSGRSSCFQQLDGAAELVSYEALLLGVAGIRADQAQRQGDEAAAMLYCEAFLVHARNLIEFFLVPEGPKDTVRASDYVEGWERGDKGEQGARLRAHRKRLHKWLSHVSFDRLGDNAPWPTGEIYNDLMYVASRFVNGLRAAESVHEPAFTTGLIGMVEGDAPRPSLEARFLPRRQGDRPAEASS